MISASLAGVRNGSIWSAPGTSTVRLPARRAAMSWLTSATSGTPAPPVSSAQTSPSGTGTESSTLVGYKLLAR